MCDRFARSTPVETIARMFGSANPPPALAPSWNIGPSRLALVVRQCAQTGTRHLDVLHWGLISYFAADRGAARLPVVAPAETISRSPLFRGAFGRRRCLVPADAFYAWPPAGRGGSQPSAVARADAAPLALGGIRERWRAPDGTVVGSFALVTTPPNAEMAPLQARMPLVVAPRDWPAWLGEDDADPVELLRPAPDGTLRAWPVSRAVNAPRNDGPALTRPVVP